MSEHEQEVLALLKLSLCKGVGNRLMFTLVDHFGSARAALEAPVERLASLRGISRDLARTLRNGPAPADMERELDLMERFATRLVPFFSDDYPPPLRHLEEDAPALLRVKGDYRPKDRLALALVGSRRATDYGRGMARRMAGDLAAAGFTVVSGLARGVDSAAHRGALAAGGRTIAVLGNGLAHELTPRRAKLAEEAASNGALISELPMTVPPLPGNFDPRNRIISGLSLGVVVVAAAARSGSLITARHAGEQGRAVFAVPGPADSPTSRGCHALIRDGAVLVTSAREVMEGLGPLSEPLELPEEAGAPHEPVRDARVMALSEREREVLRLLGSSPVHIDDVVGKTGLPPSIISSILLTLEIRGLVRQRAGQQYVRAGT